MKRKIILGTCLFSVLVILATGISFYLEIEKEKEQKKVLLIPAMQCRGHVTSREIDVNNRFKLPRLKSFEESELQEFAFFQLLYAFTNFQYNPLENILQYATLRHRPNIKIDKITEVEYGKNIEGQVSLSPFFNFKNYNWPEKVNEKDAAIIVSYQAKMVVDFCLKNDQVRPENLSFYTPVDPVYAYYYLEKKHWKHRELEPWGKTIQINLCQNLHQFFETDREYAENYWYLWNPTKRGKELHTGFYECLDFLKQGKDFYKLKTKMQKVSEVSYKEKKYPIATLENKHSSTLMKIRVVAPKEKLQDFDYYQTTIPQIFSGRNFLSTMPNISRQDKYIFRLLERINEFIVSAKLVRFEDRKVNYLFLFKGYDSYKKEMSFSIEIGEQFELESQCLVGLSYSDEIQKGAIYQINNCTKEIFFIPLAAQMSSFENIQATVKDRYYLLGQPGLADATEGSYLVEYFNQYSGISLQKYLEKNKKEEGFRLLRASKGSK